MSSKPVFRILIVLRTDPDPAFLVMTDLDPDSDPCFSLTKIKQQFFRKEKKSNIFKSQIALKTLIKDFQAQVSIIRISAMWLLHLST